MGIIFLYEFFFVYGMKYIIVFFYCFGNEERRMIVWMVKCCWVELYEFYIFYGFFCLIYYGNVVVGCYKWVGCSLVDSFYFICCY